MDVSMFPSIFNLIRDESSDEMTLPDEPPHSPVGRPNTITVHIDDGTTMTLDQTRLRINCLRDIKAVVAAQQQSFAPEVILQRENETEIEDDDLIPRNALAKIVNVEREQRDDAFYSSALASHVAIGDGESVERILDDVPSADKSTFAGAALLHAVDLLADAPVSAEIPFCRTPGDQEPIFDARDHVEMAELLLRLNADVGMVNVEGETALQLCARRGLDAGLVQCLLEQNASPEVTDERGSTVLFLACAGGHVDVVERLLGADAYIGARDHDGWTPLHTCALYDRTACANMLVDDDEECIYFCDHQGRIPLMVAVGASNSHIAHCLLDWHASHDVDTDQESEISLAPEWSGPDDTGDGVLTVACRNRYDNVVLVERLLDLHCKMQTSVNGDTVLHHAVRAGNLRIARVLLQRDALMCVNASGATPLYLACVRDHAEVASFLLQANADVNAVLNIEDQPAGDRPLLVAAREGHCEVCLELIRYDADIHATNEFGEHALGLACASGQYALVSQLLDLGAKPRADHEGLTALHEAAGGDSPRIVSLLLSQVSVLAETKTRRTPLHVACANGNAAIVSLLLERKANVSATDQNGVMPMHEASLDGHAPVVKLLLANDALLNIADVDGERPLHKAVKNGHDCVSMLLLAAKAEVDAVDASGNTALHEATKRGYASTTKVCLRHGANPRARNSIGDSTLQLAESKEFKGMRNPKERREVVAALETGGSTCAIL